MQEYQYKDSMLTKVDTSKTPKQVLNQLRTDVNVLAYQIQNWQSLAGQAYENKQQQLLAPLYNKAITAIRAVAKEKGYTYVLSKEAFLVAPMEMICYLQWLQSWELKFLRAWRRKDQQLANRINKLFETYFPKPRHMSGLLIFVICLHKIQLVFLILVMAA